jgi:carboxypeptidase C (cathepsin A)
MFSAASAAAALAALLLNPGGARCTARMATATQAVAEAPAEQLATTRHQVTIAGRTLSYTARAGLLPIRVNEAGEVRGSVFFTYYQLDRDPESSPRPLTFLWNGGPGANSVLVHLLGFGPKRIRTPDTPLHPPDCDCVLEPNDGTWLGFTDLVFVDPIGTGFSRSARAEYTDGFYGVREDVAYIAEFVRVFVNRFDAWDAPLFVGGESYGTWRAAGVAERLEETGMPVAGVLLISGGVPVGAVEEEEQRVAHLITSRTAAGFHHQRLPADLQRDLQETLEASEQWAATEYAPALARRDRLTPAERRRVVDGLVRYTGLARERIDSDALVINRQDFLGSLLQDQGVRLATFDTRQTTDQPGPPRGARAALVGRYFRTELEFATDLAYLGLERGYRPVTDSAPPGPNARWRYNHAPPDAPLPVRLTVGDGPPGARPSWVRDAMVLNPSLKVYVATGLYDSLNSCFLNRYLVSRLEEEERDNFTMACYEGGHAMYEDREVRLAMQGDVGQFVRSTVAQLDRSGASVGPRQDDRSAAEASNDQGIVTTSHAIRLDGRELRYMARAGRLPIRHNETGEVHANVFFVAYSVPPESDDAPRPLLFAWNGGPGSNAALLHMAAMGPRRLSMGDVYATADPAQMSSLVDNEATWLGATDLVFVDPVGTGYSRPTREEFGPEFYDTRGDVASLAEFIRVYLTRFDAWDAPIVLAGESYGSVRAAAVALALQRRGIDVSGLVLISGGLGVGSIPSRVRRPLSLPGFATTAIYHRKLEPELLRDPERALALVNDWAAGDYADALERLDQLSAAERETVAGELARFTGIPVEQIDRDSLVVDLGDFSEQLLGTERRVVSRYDARLSRPREASEGLFDPRKDAALAPLENKLSGNAPVMMRYLRHVLGYDSDMFYIGPFGGAWPPPDQFRGDWMSVRWNFGGGPEEPLRSVMTQNPALVVLHASGTYDLVIPPARAAYIIQHLEPELRSRITARVYEGGHSFYLDRASRLQFMRDGAALIERAAAGAAAHRPNQ